jgi:hypothetical protein
MQGKNHRLQTKSLEWTPGFFAKIAKNLLSFSKNDYSTRAVPPPLKDFFPVPLANRAFLFNLFSEDRPCGRNRKT